LIEQFLYLMQNTNNFVFILIILLQLSSWSQRNCRCGQLSVLKLIHGSHKNSLFVIEGIIDCMFHW